MIESENIIADIPFLKGKQFVVEENIYVNDMFPSCYKVSCEGNLYKLRLPSRINPNSVIKEAKALSILNKYKINNIPEIIYFDDTKKPNISYLIETYHSGESLDKIHSTLTLEDWDCISNNLLCFIISISQIHNDCFESFDNTTKQYNNYGEMLSDRIKIHIKNSKDSGVLSLELAEQIINSLYGIDKEFINQPSFLHFDIKPKNIIYDANNKTVTFIDFEHSRFGDLSHELFRGNVAAIRNPYFGECWSYVTKKLNNEHNLFKSSKTKFYYQLFLLTSELSFACSTKDTNMILNYIKRIHNLLQNKSLL